jgi:hypothetical protein
VTAIVFILTIVSMLKTDFNHGGTQRT